VGAALLVLSAFSLVLEGLGGVVLALDGAFLVALVVDLVLTPAASRARVNRTLPEHVGLSRVFTRGVELELEGARGLAVQVHEAFPLAFEVRARTELQAGTGAAEQVELDSESRREDPSGGADSLVLDGEGRGVVVRRYSCERRGEYAFGDLRVFLASRLGLWRRGARFHGSQKIAVEPALTNLSQTLRLAASDRWRDLGVRKLRRHGGASEFESLREYVPGDDVRRVDWKAFARRGKPMVRQYQVERGQELFLLVDAGRRMRATTAEGELRGWTKLDWALDAALEIAAVALSKGDRVGAAVFEHGISGFVSPARGSLQLSRLSRALFDRQPSSVESDLASALRELAVHHRRRATVLVLSDGADSLSVEEQRKALAGRSRRHRVVFAALDDPGLRQTALDPAAEPALRATALDLVEDRRRALQLLSSSGARVLDALPAEAAAPLLAAWLEERRAV